MEPLVRSGAEVDSQDPNNGDKAALHLAAFQAPSPFSTSARQADTALKPSRSDFRGRLGRLAQCLPLSPSLMVHRGDFAAAAAPPAPTLSRREALSPTGRTAPRRLGGR